MSTVFETYTRANYFWKQTINLTTLTFGQGHLQCDVLKAYDLYYHMVLIHYPCIKPVREMVMFVLLMDSI